MTSTLRTYAIPKELPTKSVMLISAYYTGSDGNYHLFPFTYTNGVLDIALVDNFKSQYIDILGIKPDDTSCSPAHRCRLLGGLGVVTSLGPNFVNYIRAAWSLGATSPVNVYQKCIVTKVQEMEESDDGTSFTTVGYYESNAPPSSDGYIANAANYGGSWIFKTPLTISIVAGGMISYVTFATTIGHDNC